MEGAKEIYRKTLRMKYSVDLLRNIIKASMGEIKSTLLIKNANLVDVIVGDIRERVNIAVWSNYIVRVGYFDEERFKGSDTQVIDASSMEVVVPGFVEPHVHVESSLMTVQEFSKAVLMHGTTTVAADPHEIGNVLGVEGVKLFIQESKFTPLRIFFYVPSCVPPTENNLDTPASRITAKDVQELLKYDEIIGLGEVMDFVSVVNGGEEVLRKIVAAKKVGKLVDGHAPQLSEEMIVPYVAAGIEGDHESVYLDEALTKLRNGMHVLMREGSAWRDVEELSKMLTYMKVNTRYLMFATDDMEVLDLIDDGHLDRVLRKAVSLGVDPITAVQMATLNSAEYLGLKEVGAVTPGRFADMVFLESFRRFKVRHVIVGGELVVKDGKYVHEQSERFRYPEKAYKTVNVKGKLKPEDLSIRAPIKEGEVEFLGIKAIPGKSVTKKVTLRLNVSDWHIDVPKDSDVGYLATIERHHATGNIGKGVVTGLGLKKGAIAQTIAHDVHNIVVVGKTPREMALAVNKLVDIGGGMVATLNNSIICYVRLPIAGLMTDEPLDKVYTTMNNYIDSLKALGVNFRSTFMTLALLSLPVIPEIRLTDKGVVDVIQGKIINPILKSYEG